LPEPLLPDETVTQDARDATVQAHGSAAVTATLDVPPLGPIATAFVESDTTHAAASCVISTRWPLTAMPPRLEAGNGLAAAVNVSVCGPCPELLDEMLSHVASAVALH
jgi:hypothetical protein